MISKIQIQSKKYAQLAGLLYVIIAVVGGVSIGYVPGEIFNESDASITFQNLREHSGLFKLGITGDIIVLILEVVLTVIIYRLFKSKSVVAVNIATLSRFAMAIIMAMNLLNYMIPLMLIS